MPNEAVVPPRARRAVIFRREITQQVIGLQTICLREGNKTPRQNMILRSLQSQDHVEDLATRCYAKRPRSGDEHV
jgi:hypothetical protein